MKPEAIAVDGATAVPHQHVPRTTRERIWPVLPPVEQDGSVLVLSPAGLHVGLSRFASEAACGLSVSTVTEKTCKFLSKWFELLAERGDVWEQMMQPRQQVQALFVELIKRDKYKVKGSGARFKVSRKAGNVAMVAHLAATIRALYDAIGLTYPEQNPFERAGWKPENHFTYKSGKQIIDAGNVFVTGKRDWTGAHNYDTTGVFAKIVAAGEAYGWPASVMLIVRIMGESGGRFCDVAPLTYADLAAEEFACAAAAPNKGSHGERVKRLGWSGLTQQMLEREIDARHAHDLEEVKRGRNLPPRPNMAQVRQLAGTPEGLEELAGLTLLPSSRGTPYSRSCFASHWFGPAMTEGKVVMRGRKGFKTPTPHWLRHFNIEEDLRRMPKDLSVADVETYEKEVLARKFLKTNQLKTYAAHEQTEKLAQNQRSLAEHIAKGELPSAAPRAPLPRGASRMTTLRAAA